MTKQTRYQYNNYDRSCAWCGEYFHAHRIHAEFCSSTCRSAYSRRKATYAKKLAQLDDLLTWFADAGRHHTNSEKLCNDLAPRRNKITAIVDDANARAELHKR